MAKKICITFLLLFIIIATVFCVQTAQGGGNSSGGATGSADYLRIHVRANSNSDEDQRVKYKVKGEVVAYLTPYISECVTKDDAIEVMSALLPSIEEVCNATLISCGFGYGASAEIRSEEFPTRVYGDLTLDAGVYDALIIELGAGTGDNWWCVIYPPLCFTSADVSVEYRSLIYDIIENFRKKYLSK